MTWVAAAIGGSALLGYMGSQNASNAQSSAANQSNATQLQMYNQTRDDQAPWRQAGATALGQLGTMTADGGSLTHQFNASDLNANMAPNYQFIKDQGMGAVNNQASVGGGLVGGNALKGIADYSNNLAGNAYQQAYNNYNTNQTNIFNRLSNIAGLGQTSNGQTAQVGMNAASNIGSGTLAGGAAAAAGYTGGSNALSGGLNNLASYYQYQNMGTTPSYGASIPVTGYQG